MIIDKNVIFVMFHLPIFGNKIDELHMLVQTEATDPKGNHQSCTNYYHSKGQRNKGTFSLFLTEKLIPKLADNKKYKCMHTKPG